MSQMINRGKELIRISPVNNKKLEYSTNGGRTWSGRYTGNDTFQDLTDNGKDLTVYLIKTKPGIFSISRCHPSLYERSRKLRSPHRQNGARG